MTFYIRIYLFWKFDLPEEIIFHNLSNRLHGWKFLKLFPQLLIHQFYVSTCRRNCTKLTTGRSRGEKTVILSLLELPRRRGHTHGGGRKSFLGMQHWKFHIVSYDMRWALRNSQGSLRGILEVQSGSRHRPPNGLHRALRGLQANAQRIPWIEWRHRYLFRQALIR